MTTDLTISLGLDDAQFRRSLQKSGGYATRQAWQISRDFERAERARERATAESMRRVQKSYRVASVAIVAGAAAIGAAMRRAAEVDPEVKSSLAALSAQYNGLMVDVGRDLGNGGMLGYLTKTIGAAREVRDFLVDGWAVILSGGDVSGVREQRAIQDQQAARDEEARRARAAGDIANRTFGEDPEQARRRALNDAINQNNLDPQRAAELRERLEATMAAERAAADREARQDADGARLTENARRARLESDTAAARAEGTGDPGDQRRARELDYRAEAAELEARVMNDKAIPAAEKQQRIQEEQALLRARYLADLQQMDTAEADRLARAREEADTLERTLAIDLARAEGRDKEARRLETILRYEQEVERIRAMSGLNEERRQRLLEQAGRVRDAELAEGDRGKGNTTIGFSGLAGGATLMRQMAGGGGPQAKVLEVARKQVRVLEQIRDKIGAAPAVAG